MKYDFNKPDVHSGKNVISVSILEEKKKDGLMEWRK